MLNKNIDFDYYYALKLILCGGELVINTKREEYYINYNKNMNYIKLGESVTRSLVNSEKIELDSGNWDIGEEFFRRTENWKIDLKKLKKDCPKLFRNEKVNILLKL